MGNGYYQEEVLLNDVDQTIGSSVTASVVSREFKLTAEGAKFLRIIVVADTVTAGGGITWSLQQWLGVNEDGNDAWAAVGAPKTQAISADGVTSMLWNNAVAADAAYLPLSNKGRITITTGAGSAVTIERISVLMGE